MGKRNPRDQLLSLERNAAEVGMIIEDGPLEEGYETIRIHGHGRDITFRPTREGFVRAFAVIREARRNAQVMP